MVELKNMKKNNFIISLILIPSFILVLIVANSQITNSQTRCTSYCRDSIFYSASYNARTGECQYSETRCDYGCNREETFCSEVPASTDSTADSRLKSQQGEEDENIIMQQEEQNENTNRQQEESTTSREAQTEELKDREIKESEKSDMVSYPEMVREIIGEISKTPSSKNLQAVYEAAVKSGLIKPEHNCPSYPELKKFKYTLKEVSKLPKTALLNMNDCDIVGLESESHVNELKEQAEAYFNEAAEIYSKMQAELEYSSKEAEKSVDKIDHCIKNLPESVGGEFGLDLAILEAVCPSYAIFSPMSYAGPILLDDKILSGNLNNMYWRLQSIYYDVNSFEATKTYLEYELYKIEEMCKAGVCISESTKDCMKQELDGLIKELGINEEEVYGKTVQMLEYFAEIQKRLDELEKKPEDCKGSFYVSFYEEDEDEGNWLGSIPTSLSDFNFSELKTEHIKKLKINTSQGAGISKKGSEIIVKKGDIEFLLDKTALKELLEMNPVKEIKVTFKGNNPYYELKGKQKAKLFWFIPVNIESSFIINAETMKLEKQKKPWWSFATKCTPPDCVKYCFPPDCTD